MNKEYLMGCLIQGMSTRDIAALLNKGESTVSYWIHKYNIAHYSKYQPHTAYSFDKIDTREKAYALGFILGDSSITDKHLVEISVSMDDKEAAEFIAKVVNGTVHYDNTFDKKTRRFPRARFTKRISDITKFTGGCSKIDRHYPRIRSDLERYLIQGFFDADGCITWGRRKDRDRIWQKVCFTSQEKILYGVQNYLIKRLDISTVLRPKSGEHCYVLEFANREDVLKFCEHIYPDDDFIILNRKYLKYKALRLELEENGEGVKRDDNTVPSLQSRKV